MEFGCLKHDCYSQYFGLFKSNLNKIHADSECVYIAAMIQLISARSHKKAQTKYLHTFTPVRKLIRAFRRKD